MTTPLQEYDRALLQFDVESRQAILTCPRQPRSKLVQYQYEHRALYVNEEIITLLVAYQQHSTCDLEARAAEWPGAVPELGRSFPLLEQPANDLPLSTLNPKHSISSDVD
jgi:hypothetical protein